MNMNTNLFSKNGYAITYLAKKFISYDVGDRILTITQYSKDLGLSRGTIQSSLKYLVDREAISLETRGHLGTFLKDRNLSKLLEISGVNFLIGTMPLPYSKRYEGLSTGISKSFERKINIPINMAYMRGAKKRIEMVENGRCDFAITSKYSALEAIKKYKNIEIVKELKPHSFLSKHVLLFRKGSLNQIKDGMKAGIDKSSIDQENLTKKFCYGKKINFINISYNQLIDKIISGEIDFSVWNGDEIKDKYRNIETKDIDINYDINTIAVILADKNRYEIRKILQDSIDPEFVENIQTQVLSNEIMPKY